MADVPVERLRVTRGSDYLTLYQWNTKVAEHYFCNTCGIYTHHRRRSAPDEYGFNIACIDGVDLDSFNEIKIGDGASLSIV